jgi:chemotaxis signal transduction protein
MLCLLYHVKDTQFLVDTSYVVEIIHRVNTVGSSATPHKNFEGLINYRGQLIPLLDFCFFYSGERAEPRIHSRIIIMESLDERRIGLLAEGVIRTVEVHRNDFLENTIGGENFAYISGLWNTPLGVIKNVDVPLLFDICYEGASYG